MKLKPFRDYDEHEVLNLFAAQEGDLEGGTFVSFVSFDPDNHSSYGAVVPNLAGHVHTSTYVVNARVKQAVDNTGVVGLTLKDVKSVIGYGPFSTPAAWADHTRLAEQQAVPSGQAVPILTRGTVEISGFSGVPLPGLAAVIVTSGANSGQLTVAAAGTTPRVGVWLSQSGKDGAALLRVHCI